MNYQITFLDSSLGWLLHSYTIIGDRIQHGNTSQHRTLKDALLAAQNADAVSVEVMCGTAKESMLPPEWGKKHLKLVNA